MLVRVFVQLITLITLCGQVSRISQPPSSRMDIPVQDAKDQLQINSTVQDTVKERAAMKRWTGGALKGQK